MGRRITIAGYRLDRAGRLVKCSAHQDVAEQANVNGLRVCIVRAPMVQDFHIFVGKGSGLIGAPIV